MSENKQNLINVIGKRDSIAEIERRLLGKILLENEMFWVCRPHVKAEDFSVQAHQDLFADMEKLINDNEPADPFTLSTFNSAQINEKPAFHYYLALTKNPVHMVEIEDYARIIREYSKRVKFSMLTAQASEYALKTTKYDDSDSYINQFETKLLELKLEYETVDSANRSIESVCNESLELFLQETVSEEEIYPTIGLKSVTNLMGPITPGCVYVLAGRPGSGKTAAAVAAARSIIRQNGPEGQKFGVGFISLEMTKKDIWARFVACEMAMSQTPIYYKEIKRRELGGAKLEAVANFSNSLKKFSLFIEDKSAMTVADIHACIREEQYRLSKNDQRLDVVFIDYIQIIKPSKRYQGNKVAEISQISSGLVHLAKTLNVAVVAISQLSRKVEDRNDKRPIMPDIRESGQIEQDANSIIFLYRPAYYDNQQTKTANADDLAKFQARENDLHYIVAKARDGITGEAIVYTDIGRNQIREK